MDSIKLKVKVEEDDREIFEELKEQLENRAFLARGQKYFQY